MMTWASSSTRWDQLLVDDVGGEIGVVAASRRICDMRSAPHGALMSGARRLGPLSLVSCTCDVRYACAFTPLTAAGDVHL